MTYVLNESNDVLNTPVKELFTAGIIAFLVKGVKVAQVMHTSSVVRLLGRIEEELSTNKYRNREIQDRYNKGELELLLLERVDLSGIDNADVKDLTLRYKSLLHCNALRALGYVIVNSYNPVSITAKAVIENPRRSKAPQVLMSIARGKKYYVQKLFASMFEAESYVKNTDILQIIHDTGGVQYPFVTPEMGLDIEHMRFRHDRRKYNNKHEPMVVNENGTILANEEKEEA